MGGCLALVDSLNLSSRVRSARTERFWPEEQSEDEPLFPLCSSLVARHTPHVQLPTSKWAGWYYSPKTSGVSANSPRQIILDKPSVTAREHPTADSVGSCRGHTSGIMRDHSGQGALGGGDHAQPVLPQIPGREAVETPVAYPGFSHGIGMSR